VRYCKVDSSCIDGEPVRAIVGYDATAMYAFALSQAQPVRVRSFPYEITCFTCWQVGHPVCRYAQDGFRPHVVSRQRHWPLMWLAWMETTKMHRKIFHIGNGRERVVYGTRLFEYSDIDTCTCGCVRAGASHKRYRVDGLAYASNSESQVRGGSPHAA